MLPRNISNPFPASRDPLAPTGQAKVSLGGKLALLFPLNLFCHKMSPLFPDQFSCSP